LTFEFWGDIIPESGENLMIALRYKNWNSQAKSDEMGFFREIRKSISAFWCAIGFFVMGIIKTNALYFRIRESLRVCFNGLFQTFVPGCANVLPFFYALTAFLSPDAVF